MKKAFLLLIFIGCINFSYSQNRIEGTDYISFTIEKENDKIDFVIADTVLNTKKPLLLFCQGSLPMPLFMDMGSNRIVPMPLENFDLEEMRKYYHVVVISMPKTPMIVKFEELSDQYYYLGDTINKRISKEFFLADYSENYLRRANVVIDYLKNKEFIDASKVVVCGHSQGSRVAVGIASSNKNVTHLGLFGYNYERRIDGIIKRTRSRAENGVTSWEDVDSIQAEQYQFYKDILNDDSLKATPHLTSWRSFSKSTID